MKFECPSKLSISIKCTGLDNNQIGTMTETGTSWHVPTDIIPADTYAYGVVDKYNKNLIRKSKKDNEQYAKLMNALHKLSPILYAFYNTFIQTNFIGLRQEKNRNNSLKKNLTNI